MAQAKITKCLGLIKNYNPIAIPDGALQIANNIRIRRENVIENRRGSSLYGTSDEQIEQFLTYQNTLLVHKDTNIAYDNGSGTLADYSGSYSAPSGARVHFSKAFSNLYVTTSLGVKVFSGVSGTAGRLAGAPRALDPSYTLTGSSGFLTNAYQCAYKALIQRTDSQNNVIVGYPSQRLWVINGAGGNRNVILTMYLPSECVAGDLVKFYRTEKVSGTTADTSGEEMGLIYQVKLVSGDISAGFVTFTDIVVDELRGATLYTSPSQEGIKQANERPPIAKDMCLYRSKYMLYANIATKERLFSTIVGVTAFGHTSGADTHTNTTLDNVADTSYIEIGWKVTGTGIPASTTVANIVGSTVTLSQAATGTASITATFITNDTVTLGGVAYSFGTTEITSGAGSPQVQVGLTGVAAADIDSTARSFIRVINRYASNTTVYAYYLSDPSDLPGQLMVEEKGIGAAPFTIMCSDSDIGAMFFPQPPVSPTTTTECTSTNDEKQHYVYFSKSEQPEAVPLLNYLPVGSANSAILRIVALQSSAIIIKEDGVFRLTGVDSNSFVVEELDLTVRCKAAESVAALANQVYMLSNQGVVTITESGIQIVSKDIKPLITPLLQNTSLSSFTFGWAYESENIYCLSTITDITDLSANQTLVYNWSTKTWVRDDFAVKAAIVEDSLDVQYYAKASDLRVYKERKAFNNTDMADPEFDITITAISGTTITFTALTTPEVGWVIKQDLTGVAISSVVPTGGAWVAVIADDPPATWATGAAYLFPSVGAEWEWHAWTAQAPEVLKQVWGVAILADDTASANFVSSLGVVLKSNFDQNEDEVTLSVPGGGWGSAWGESPWGGEGDSFGYPTYVTRNKQMCTRLSVGVRHRVALEKMACVGVAFEFNAASDRIGK